MYNMYNMTEEGELNLMDNMMAYLFIVKWKQNKTTQPPPILMQALF